MQGPGVRLELPDDFFEALLLFEALLHGLCKRSMRARGGPRLARSLTAPPKVEYVVL
jgi:hypothetical protein